MSGETEDQSVSKINEEPSNLKPKKERKSNENIGRQQIADAITALSNTLAQQASENRRKEKRQNTTNKWIRGATLVFVIVVTLGLFWQASIFNEQLVEAKKVFGPLKDQADASKKAADSASKAAEAMTRQTEISEKALIQSQRAWVGPRNARFESQPTVGQKNKLVVEYQNTGNEPALGIGFYVEPFTATLAEDSNGDVAKKLIAYVTKCSKLPSFAGAGVAYPTSGLNASNLTAPIEDLMIDDDVMSGKRIILLSGCFAYQTGGAVHHSAYCYFYQNGRVDSGHLAICQSGNYAD